MVYRTVIRPILDYCAVIYQPMVTDEQNQTIERMQANTLKSIYGFGISYAKMREMTGITIHRARCIELCDKFAKKVLDSPRFEESWFPERVGVRKGGMLRDSWNIRPGLTGFTIIPCFIFEGG